MSRAVGRSGALAAVAVAAVVASGGVPLYDGVGFPDEPYRYVHAPAGAKHGPPAEAATASSAAAGTNTDELALQTAEQGPQLLLDLPSGSVRTPAGASKVSIVATPLAPDRQPADGTVDGNVYRVTVTSDAGPASFGPDVGQSFLYLRAATTKPALPVMEYRASPQAPWQPLKTGKGGADVLVSAFKGTGDYALVHQKGAHPTGGGPSQETLLLALVGGFVVLVGAAVALTRHRAGQEEESDG